MGKSPLEKLIMHPYFVSRVDVDQTTNCWLWNGSVNSWGYGRTINNISPERAAHRISFHLHKGPIPRGLLVLHSCDVPRCCNPEHLFLGTNADNMRDMVRKGRRPARRGERSSAAKLTAAQVNEIRSSYELKQTVSSLSRRFGVSRRTIKFILDGVTWKRN